MTRMEQEDISFGYPLKQAQNRGLRRRNPEADVEGHDACRKIAILSSLMCGKTVRYGSIPCRRDQQYLHDRRRLCAQHGQGHQLLGIGRHATGRQAPSMCTALHGSRLTRSTVWIIYSAVFVHGNLVDNLMFYRHGAGKFRPQAL